MTSTFWGNLVNTLMQEQGISERKLAIKAGVNRTTLRNFKAGKGGLDIYQLELLLNALGHELVFLPMQEKL